MQDHAKHSVSTGESPRGLSNGPAQPGAKFPGRLHGRAPLKEVLASSFAEAAERARLVAAVPERSAGVTNT
eukprot:11162461-Lingulodinium_polyedra.AAC.1